MRAWAETVARAPDTDDRQHCNCYINIFLPFASDTEESVNNSVNDIFFLITLSIFRHVGFFDSWEGRRWRGRPPDAG